MSPSGEGGRSGLMPCTGNRLGSWTLRPPVEAGLGATVAGAVVGAGAGADVGAEVGFGAPGALVGAGAGAVGVHASSKAMPLSATPAAASRMKRRRSTI